MGNTTTPDKSSFPMLLQFLNESKKGEPISPDVRHIAVLVPILMLAGSRESERDLDTSQTG
jgi:hypothetical protein